MAFVPFSPHISPNTCGYYNTIIPKVHGAEGHAGFVWSFSIHRRDLPLSPNNPQTLQPEDAKP